MRRRKLGGFVVSLFVLAALALAMLIGGAQNGRTVFLALLALGWCLLANLFCAGIASYRFQKPDAKYIEIKNKLLRKILVRPFRIDGTPSMAPHDRRTNVIGLFLNLINVAIFVVCEILLLLPPIPCEPYVFELYLPKRVGVDTRHILLNSYNQIIAAEMPQAFTLVLPFIYLAFIILFERQLKKLERERSGAKGPPEKLSQKCKRYFSLFKKRVKEGKLSLKEKISCALCCAFAALDIGAIVAVCYFYGDRSLRLTFFTCIIAFTFLTILSFVALLSVHQEQMWEAEWEWRHSLREALWGLSVRKYAKPGKKRKYWYRPDQLDEIRALLDERPAKLSLQVVHKEGRAASFRILEEDEGAERLFFLGFFVR